MLYEVENLKSYTFYADIDMTLLLLTTAILPQDCNLSFFFLSFRHLEKNYEKFVAIEELIYLKFPEDYIQIQLQGFEDYKLHAPELIKQETLMLRKLNQL